MGDLLKKLNHRGEPIALVNVPSEIAADVKTRLTGADLVESVPEQVDFALVFVRSLEEIETFGSDILRRARGDAMVWFCYPKQSSKRFSCDFNRDTGWKVLAEYRYEPVRQVAFDEDWSALRFRDVDHIKTLSRRASFAVTDEARTRTTGQGR